MTLRIVSLFHEKGFGFASANDVKFFFHKQDLIAGLRFEDLAVGQMIDAAEVASIKGPRVGFVRTVNRT